MKEKNGVNWNVSVTKLNAKTSGGDNRLADNQ